MRFAVLMPVVFVFLWSTGWINARAAAPHADPFTFLALRFGLSLAVMVPLCLAWRVRWPARAADWGHIVVSGLLLHAVYLGGVWWAVKNGLPAGISGLIAALQPLFTALAAGPLAGERLGRRQVGGVLLGLAGVALVLYPKLAGVVAGAHLFWPIAVNVLGMVGVTAGTFYQKRFVHGGDLRSVVAVQYLGVLPPILLIAWLTEPMRFDITVESVAALVWSVFALSIGAIVLMLEMIRRGEVSRVASLIYLMPPAVAVQAWLLFGETLLAVQVVGMAITAFGVYLTIKTR